VYILFTTTLRSLVKSIYPERNTKTHTHTQCDLSNGGAIKLATQIHTYILTLEKAKNVWGMVSQLLKGDGGDATTMCRFYRVIVHQTLRKSILFFLVFQNEQEHRTI
jgi:hypothetical protein